MVNTSEGWNRKGAEKVLARTQNFGNEEDSGKTKGHWDSPPDTKNEDIQHLRISTPQRHDNSKCDEQDSINDPVV
jgi:hypothetical protein